MKYFIHLIAGFPGQHTSSPGCYDYVNGYQLMQEGSIELTEGDYNPQGITGFGKVTDKLLIETLENIVEQIQVEKDDTSSSYALIKVADDGTKEFIEWA